MTTNHALCLNLTQNYLSFQFKQYIAITLLSAYFTNNANRLWIGITGYRPVFYRKHHASEFKTSPDWRKCHHATSEEQLLLLHSYVDLLCSHPWLIFSDLFPCDCCILGRSFYSPRFHEFFCWLNSMRIKNFSSFWSCRSFLLVLDLKSLLLDCFFCLDICFDSHIP